MLFTKTFSCCRFVYNRMLADKTLHYDSTKESLYKPQQYKTEFEWLGKWIHSHCETRGYISKRLSKISFAINQ
ncbi:MAG: helix-turn-helix domain-containing protein [Christensenellaceae bacterium]|nr:helix-turn-helix domain-containing protein [Christensenellaceae bacterium]